MEIQSQDDNNRSEALMEPSLILAYVVQITLLTQEFDLLPSGHNTCGEVKTESGQFSALCASL